MSLCLSVCKSQDSAGENRIILRVILMPKASLFRPYTHPDTCTDSSRRILGFTVFQSPPAGVCLFNLTAMDFSWCALSVPSSQGEPLQLLHGHRFRAMAPCLSVPSSQGAPLQLPLSYTEVARQLFQSPPAGVCLYNKSAMIRPNMLRSFQSPQTGSRLFNFTVATQAICSLCLSVPSCHGEPLQLGDGTPVDRVDALSVPSNRVLTLQPENTIDTASQLVSFSPLQPGRASATSCEAYDDVRLLPLSVPSNRVAPETSPRPAGSSKLLMNQG